ncbi:hypothetical protein K437DRAFT_27353 [Tilletiaria anomala UBC 951]|uniref:Cytochrome c oxidase subunit 8, mitochondrial n=1 Tax=Tilletiaria anomala (strain ATCC 24038 / CBS 436.72 / UBC 951) TaxID=1037660 RepID=A0A066VA40_TILAU|nr:uncharacterized protein K437DRAFT_27353 [Tilletiaria anomala UBC 951]KDN38321.1 hypothetical protein K437DRAFT_27353 [Tilletiaria anomala UBC 951]
MIAALASRRAVPVAARALRQPQMQARRAMHIENTAETVMPFKQGPSVKVPIAVCLTLFLAGGFSLPFIAARFQM